MLARLGSWCYRRPWSVLGIWLAVVAVFAGAAGGLGGAKYLENFELPDSDSSSGIDVLAERFSGVAGSGFEGTIVFRSTAEVTDPTVREPMEKLFAQVEKLDEFVVSSPYAEGVEDFQISEDRHTAFAQLTIDPDTDFNRLAELGDEIRSQIPKIKGTEVAVGGAMLAEFKPPKSELIGLAFAIIVLIVAFGSVLAMGLPIAVALAGVGLGAVVVTVASHVTEIPEMSTIIGTMIGLGVGIDYALFIVTRYREQLHAGHSGAEAASIALDTAGRAVLFAGMTVVISLLGMLAIGLSFIGGMGVSAAITVAVTMIASVTLLPALLGFAKFRVELTRLRGLLAAGFVALGLLSVGLNLAQGVWVTAFAIAGVVLVSGLVLKPLRREIPPRVRKPANETLSFRWSHFIQRHPWFSMSFGAAMLLVMAIPVLSMRIGSADEGNFPEGTDVRRAYDLLADGFGPGFSGPLVVTAQGTSLIQALGVIDKLEATDGVAKVVGPIPSNVEELSTSGLGALIGGDAGDAGETGEAGAPAGLLPSDPDELLAFDLSVLRDSDAAALLPEDFEELLAPTAIMFQVLPETSPQSTETVELIDRIRDEVVPEIQALAPDSVMHVTGNTAVNVDFSTYLSGRTPMFFGIVLALSFLLLMAVFRSILVPLKA
ncbi:MAG: MMPL family transporter, partial [Actinobacteria bacterium]|nr:MMPL family transporter [Actinomycetota bacterium]